MKDSALTVESVKTTGSSIAAAVPRQRRSRARAFSRVLPVIATTLALTGCQSILEQSYQPDVQPSQTPQIVDEVQKNDPRAEMGARERPRILATYGGEYQDVKTEQLVARITGALTAVSENPKQTYRITILNSPAINAFALPGGYIYVTRGLLALADDASEVAAVLSHEMGHVTANHGILRQQKEEAEMIASRVVTEVLSSELAGKQALARSKLRLAAFSRAQELQADQIGVRMLGEAGYDPYAAARFLDTMGAFQNYNAGDQNSDQGLDFLSTHPSTPQRVELARMHARQFGMDGKVGDKGRDYFLAGIDGLLYGDSPTEGYVRGETFLHPNLGVRFDVPPNFRIDNKAEAVMATGPNQVAIRFDLVDDTSGGSLTDYISSGWVTGLMPETIRAAFVNGMPAATARASAERWDFDVTVVRNGPKIYRFLTAVPKGDANDLQLTAAKLRASFRRLSPAEITNLKPLRIRVVVVGPSDTVATLANRMLGTDRKPELFRLLNGMSVDATVKPGDKVKIVAE